MGAPSRFFCGLRTERSRFCFPVPVPCSGICPDSRSDLGVRVGFDSGFGSGFVLGSALVSVRTSVRTSVPTPAPASGLASAMASLMAPVLAPVPPGLPARQDERPVGVHDFPPAGGGCCVNFGAVHPKYLSVPAGLVVVCQKGCPRR